MPAIASATTHRQRQNPEPSVERRAFRAFELPAVLGLSRPFITRLIASGDLPTFTVGRCRFVASADLDYWIERQRAATGTAGGR